MLLWDHIAFSTAASCLGSHPKEDSEKRRGREIQLRWTLPPKLPRLHYATKNGKKSVPGKRPNFYDSLGPIITEMGISFDLKMLFRFSDTFFDFWPRNSVFGPPCPVLLSNRFAVTFIAFPMSHAFERYPILHT